MSGWLLSISKDADSTTALDNLCQHLVTLTVRKCFLMFRGHLLCFCLCPLPLVLSLGTNAKSLAPSYPHPPFRYSYTLISSPWVFSSPGWTIPALSPFPHRRDAPVPSPFLWPFSGLSAVCPCLSCIGEPKIGHDTPAAVLTSVE